MRDFDVRRLAAIDMWGFRGSMTRRRLILIEFVVGACGGIGLGIWMLVRAPGRVGWLLVIWLIGVGFNYVALAAHAISLSRSGVLERELADVDVSGELAHYTTAQFRVVVPFWVAILALRQVS